MCDHRFDVRKDYGLSFECLPHLIKEIQSLSASFMEFLYGI